MMKKISMFFVILILTVIMASTSLATVVSFDNYTPDLYTVINTGEVLFTNTLSPTSRILVESASDGWPDPFSGNIIKSYNVWFTPFWIRADLSVPANQISVTIGNLDVLSDHVVMGAYSSNGSLLADVMADTPASAYSVMTLSLSTTDLISYVLFNGRSGAFWGSTYFDNFTYDYIPSSVPEPATLLLFGIGLLGLGAAKRKFK